MTEPVEDLIARLGQRVGSELERLRPPDRDAGRRRSSVWPAVFVLSGIAAFLALLSAVAGSAEAWLWTLAFGAAAAFAGSRIWVARHAASDTPSAALARGGLVAVLPLTIVVLLGAAIAQQGATVVGWTVAGLAVLFIVATFVLAARARVPRLARPREQPADPRVDAPPPKP